MKTPTGTASATGSKAPLEVDFSFPDGTQRVIQVNCCKNPNCLNFGVPASLAKHAHRSKAAPGPGVDYKLGMSTAGVPQLRCLLCAETLPMKSNAGVCEEIHRMTKHFVPETRPSCKTAHCKNNGVAAPSAKSYYAFGRTDAGSKRYQCRLCKKTFSISTRRTLRQRVARKNVPIFEDLVHKKPLSRLVFTNRIAFQTFYDKLDFFHEQALAFNGKYEARLPEVIKGTKRYIAVDRQDYPVNWVQRKDKRNVTLRAIGSADIATGYVFGMHLNFDGEKDAAAVEADAVDAGDYACTAPYRKHARLWLAGDYAGSVAESSTRAASRAKPGASLEDRIASRYAEADIRGDVESPDAAGRTERYPTTGMQVRLEYTMYGHFYYLQYLLGKAAKVRFFMDQESGIRAACLASFELEIRQRSADAFYVRLAKDSDYTVDAKRKLILKSRALFQQACADNPTLPHYEVQVLMMREQLFLAAAHGKWKDRWAKHPFPNQAEPEKSICYLTDMGDMDEHHKARLFLKASLHPIDRFFASIRRHLNMLERPIGTASKAGRTWYGYSAYQPYNIEKMLTVYRTYYNFCLPGRDQKTPAMRLGLADKVMTVQQLLGM